MAAIANKARSEAHSKVEDLVLIDADASERARLGLKLRASAVWYLAGEQMLSSSSYQQASPGTASTIPGRVEWQRSHLKWSLRSEI